LSKLLLVRHGVTEFNDSRRFAGYSDVEMTPAGYEQVERLRDRLVNERIDAVYASDLKRTMATAEVISSGRQVEIVPCPELRECNYGDAEGLTFQEINSRYPEMAKFIVNFNLRLEFPGGESFTDFIERTVKFLDRLNEHEPSETILVASHSGPLRVLFCALLGIDQDHWWQVRVDNASLSIADTYPRGAIISLLNDTYHLKEES
jgi:alpha-ribazole phosphatase